ncbi:MAG: hypothetical protein V3V19_11355 [Cocleimonas sp.]
MGWGKDKDNNWVPIKTSKEGEFVRLDHKEAIAKNIIEGAYPVNKFGGNPDIDTGQTKDITDNGFTWDWFPSGAQTVSIVSDNSTDNIGGAGARTIEIEGIDNNDIKESEILNLNGTTPIVSSKSYKCLFRAIIRTGGSGGENAGIIIATGSVDSGITMAVILPGNNETLMAVFAVESGKEAFIHSLQPHILRTQGLANDAEITLLSKPMGEVWQVKATISVVSLGSSSVPIVYRPPRKLSPLTLFKLRANNVSSNNTSVGCAMDITVEPIQ